MLQSATIHHQFASMLCAWHMGTSTWRTTRLGVTLYLVCAVLSRVPELALNVAIRAAQLAISKSLRLSVQKCMSSRCSRVFYMSIVGDMYTASVKKYLLLL